MLFKIILWKLSVSNYSFHKGKEKVKIYSTETAKCYNESLKHGSSWVT